MRKVSDRAHNAATRNPGDLVLSSAVRDSALEGGALTFIGTATVLARFGPFTFLTDPNFLHAGDHAHLGYGLRSERLTEPAMTLDDLPPLDFVLLSHHHGDHFDQIVEAELDRATPIITEPRSAAKLRRLGFTQVRDLRTWQSMRVRRDEHWIRITAMPGRHAPRGLQLLLPSVMGSMLELGRGDSDPLFRAYITGDTLVIDEIADIPRRFPGIDLCLIHLGGTRIAGVLLTMDAEQGVRMLQIVRPHAAIPIHYDDYTVFRSPLDDFRQLAERLHLSTELHYLDRGDTYRFDVNTGGFR
jgi:L-ascorbate metabolism protein UlaG (beta-lactamase superfamily)